MTQIEVVRMARQKLQTKRVVTFFDKFKKQNVLNQDVLVHIFGLLDKSSLGSILVTCKEWYTLLQDDSVWKKLSLNKYPNLKKININFSKKSNDDSWQFFYLNRIDREQKAARLLQNLLIPFQKSGNRKDFHELIDDVSDLDKYSQVAGFFPNTEFTSGELGLLADTIIYTTIDQQVDNILYRSKEVSCHYYCIKGKIIGLDGKQHSFHYSHEWNQSAQGNYTKVAPNIWIGEFPLEPEVGEIDESNLRYWLNGVKKLLGVKETEDKLFFDFIMEYMISNPSMEVTSETWGEIQYMLEGNKEEENEDDEEEEEEDEEKQKQKVSKKNETKKKKKQEKEVEERPKKKKKEAPKKKSTKRQKESDDE